MKKWLVLSFIVALFFILPLSVLASDVTDANYIGTISSTNTGTAITDGVSSNISGLNTAAMIASSILNAGATNVVARDPDGNDAAIMPGNGTSPWIIFLSSIAANVTVNSAIYTGDVTGGKIVYSPAAAGMTVLDNDPTLEMSSNGSVEFTNVYINPASGASKYLFEHYDLGWGGIRAYISDSISGNLTAEIINTSSMYRPNAAGDLTQLTPSAGNNYACSGDNNDATFVYQTTSSYKQDLYNMPNTSESGTIVSVNAFFRIATGAGQTVNAKPLWKIGGTVYEGTEQSVTGATPTSKVQIYTVSPATSAAWTWAELDSAQYGIEIKSPTSNTVYSYDIWYYIVYATPATVTGLSGEHDIKVAVETTDLNIYVDGSLEATTALGGLSVPNSTANWAFLENDAAAYCKSIEIYVGGNQTGYWYWENSATLTDHSPIGTNTATPTYRTTSSDADVTSTLVSFSPTSEAEASGSAVSSWPSMFTAVPTEPDTSYSENATPGLIGSTLINDLTVASGHPEFESFFWFNFTFATIIFGGMLAFRMHQSLMLKTIVMGAIMILWALPGPNVYGMFVVIYFGMFAFGINVLGKSYGW